MDFRLTPYVFVEFPKSVHHHFAVCASWYIFMGLIGQGNCT